MLEEYRRDEALIHFQRGLVFERANRVQEAVEEYRRAIAHYPHFREAHDALGFYYQRYGMLAKAADAFRVVTNLEGDFLSYFNLGYVLLELGRYDEALAALMRCLEIESGDPAAHYEIGLLHYMRADYQTAIEHLQVPLRCYTEDWEVHHLVGRCYLRLGRYDQALKAFTSALHLAPRPAAQAEVIEQMCSIERYRELCELRCAKDQLYANHGIVCLGSAQDDGLHIDELQDYHFTYPDIGITLRRLLSLYQGCEWRFTCIVALDRLATPLTAALAQILRLPQRYADELDPADLPLLVLAVGRESELLELALERVPGESVAFCLGLNWLRHGSMLPDITGVITRSGCSVPWEPELRRLRSDGAPTEQVEQCLHNAVRHILAAVHDAPVEPNQIQQVQYYASKHRSLRFADSFEDVPALIDR